MDEKQDPNAILSSILRPTDKKQTAGAIASELMQKAPESRDPIELEREMQKNYVDELIKCALVHKTQYHGDFYLVVLTKNERLMQNIFRNYFTARKSCPTPEYDQSVYRFMSESDSVEYLWTVPSKDAVAYIKEFAKYLPPAERSLAEFVHRFENGDLMKLSKRLNGEAIDSPFLVQA